MPPVSPDSDEFADDVPAIELAEVKALAHMGLWDHTRGSAEDQSLIPRVVFYENAKQNADLREMARDLLVGEHILLVGNQGVGKNKLADYLMQILRAPREYLQLHRDTTIEQLTAVPKITNGVLTYEDSPLVIWLCLQLLLLSY